MKIEMKRTPGLKWVALASVVVCLGLAGTAWADAAPDDVLAAAQSGLPVFLQALPAGELANYGFANAGELAQAALGEPYQVHVLTLAALRAYTPDQRLGALTQPADQWYFPVTVNGAPRTMLIVAKVAERWQAVAIGGTALPKNLALGGQALAGGKAGAQAQYVQVRQANADFLWVPAADADYLMPVMASPKALGVQNFELYAAADMVGPLRQRVQENIQLEQNAVNATFGGGGAPAGPPQAATELRAVLESPAVLEPPVVAIQPANASAPAASTASKRAAPSPLTYLIALFGVLVIGGLALAWYKLR
jgi:hypothetical protein